MIEPAVSPIGVVGPGKVGLTLARVLADRGHQVIGPLGRTDPVTQLVDARVVILAVPDDAIAPLFERLARAGAIDARHVVVHCSGLVSSDVLSNSSLVPAGRAAMHPMLAFADVERAILELPGTTFGVEGDDTGIAAARRLVSALDGRVALVPPGARAHYHLACVLTSNGLVALTDMAVAIMTAGGVEADGIGEGLAHLVEGTAGNMARLGVRPSMTGPVLRGDARTVGTHLRILDEAPDEVRDCYRAITRRLVAMAIESGRQGEDRYAAILALLDER